jgi:oxygen-independent coproporphyrinogen-3 oxidase
MRGHSPPPAAGPGAHARAAARTGLYVHVPFCAVRCGYCDFSTGALTSAAVERWAGALEREIAMRAHDARGIRFTSVFFGGGTPSAIAPAVFARLWAAIAAAFDVAPDAEITLEANPESVTDARLEAWREAGVNRLSLGVQSFDASELAMLDRVHGPQTPARAVERARRHGFERLSVDLIFGGPGQTRTGLAESLERAIALGVEHVSAYCFIPEPGTPLGNAVRAGRAVLPSAGRQAAMYAQLTRRLAASGYACYETSNFARPGAEARHNLVYWLRRPYLALGPSAHGFWNGERYGNHYALARWAEALDRGLRPEHERERPGALDAATETLLLALRLARGFDPADHPDAGAVLDLFGPALEHAVLTGRLVRTAGTWRVPARHRFVADDVIAWIVARAARPVDSARVDSRSSQACPNPPSPVS